jgi:HPt (histidine-containing phosphotransfer) domain-containing protein
MTVKLDLSYLENMSGGDKGLMKEMFDIFKEQVPEFVTEMNSCLENEDWKKLASIAHKAKSSIAIIGLNDLTEELKKFENNVIQINNVSGFKSFILHFEETCKQAVIQLEIIFSNH